ncbi:MAG: radical SAM protein [Deltaproteobacteria bacterium]|nr:radical SAM protein [Deltaproteobacteria bacterium]
MAGLRLNVVRGSSAPAVRPGAPRSVLMVLPPDVDAPEVNRLHRFPPQGPALVAAAIARDGFVTRAVDLELSVFRRPPAADTSVLDDDAALGAHLRGDRHPGLEALAADLVARIEAPGDYDLVALSLDRHTQIRVAALIAVEFKRRYGTPSILGGVNARAAHALLTELGALGVDVVTAAATPDEIRYAFGALRELSPGRLALPVEPIAEARDTPADEWPVPDFGIYRLDDYRYDPFAVTPHPFSAYDGSVGGALFLPYHFTFECQYKCTFCQNGGTQGVKSMPRVVRDLAEMSERWGVRDFMLFDTQINLHAVDFSRALIEARLDLHWSDSYRVMPSREGDLELMARAGCVGLTLGVESGSEKILKRMIKGHRPFHATRVIREAHRNEIMVRANLLPCFPGETREDLQDTIEWTRENAFAIDDLAPSSFYLVRESPIGDDPARFGITIRGQRVVDGDYKFRKQLGSLTYDEVGGMTWEERQATLRPAEEMLRQAWREGRGERAVLDSMQPAFIFALRRRFATKGEAYAAALRFTGGPSPVDHPRRDASAEPPRVLSPVEPGDGVTGRFEVALREAMPQLERNLGRTLAGHMVLFDDGDFVCFGGSVGWSDDPSPAPRTLSIENMLAYRFGAASTRRRVYGRLVPGAAVRVSGDALTSAGGEPWAEPLRYGRDFHVLTFGPPRPGEDMAPLAPTEFRIASG